VAERDDPLALKAHELAQEAIRRIEGLERVYEERTRAEERRHAETRGLIVELRQSFGENFTALKESLNASIGNAVTNISARMDGHEKSDNERFGVISNRSWSAMWALNGLLVMIVLGLIGVVWTMMHQGTPPLHP